MTDFELLDHYAGLAMPACIEFHRRDFKGDLDVDLQWREFHEHIANDAFDIALTMLAVRSQVQEVMAKAHEAKVV